MGGTGEECVEVVRGCDGALARDLHRRKRSLGRANKPPVGGECVPAQEGVGGGDLRPPGKGGGADRAEIFEQDPQAGHGVAGSSGREGGVGGVSGGAAMERATIIRRPPSMAARLARHVTSHTPRWMPGGGRASQRLERVRGTPPSAVETASATATAAGQVQ